MDQLILGGRVRVVSQGSPLNCRVGRIRRVIPPFGQNGQVKAEGSAMPLVSAEMCGELELRQGKLSAGSNLD